MFVAELFTFKCCLLEENTPHWNPIKPQLLACCKQKNSMFGIRPLADTSRQKLVIYCVWEGVSWFALSGHCFDGQEQIGKVFFSILLVALVSIPLFGWMSNWRQQRWHSQLLVCCCCWSFLIPHLLHWLPLFPIGAVKTKCSPVAEVDKFLMWAFLFDRADKRKQRNKKNLWIFEASFFTAWKAPQWRRSTCVHVGFPPHRYGIHHFDCSKSLWMADGQSL